MRPPRTIGFVLSAAMILSGLLPATALADVLVLRDGARVRGSLLSSDAQTVRFEVDGRERIFPRAEVRRILLQEPKPAAPAGEDVPRIPAVVPSGTTLLVRVEEELATRSPGTRFEARLSRDLEIKDMVVAERGTRLRGRITRIPAWRTLADEEVLRLELTRIWIDDRPRTIVTGDYRHVVRPEWERQEEEPDPTEIVERAPGEEIAPLASDLELRGPRIRVPVGTFLEFRLDEPLPVR